MRYGGNVIDVRYGIQRGDVAVFADHTVHCGRVKGIFFCANVQIPECEVRELILCRFRFYVEVFAALTAAVLHGDVICIGKRNVLAVFQIKNCVHGLMLTKLSTTASTCFIVMYS